MVADRRNPALSRAIGSARRAVAIFPSWTRRAGVPLTRGRSVPMKDSPQGLNNWANPAVAASTSATKPVAAELVTVFSTTRQYDHPFDQVSSTTPRTAPASS